MIEVAFEKDKIGARQVKEEIRSFRMQIPEGVSCAPKRMLLVNPFPFLLVLLGKGSVKNERVQRRHTFQRVPRRRKDSNSKSEALGNN